MSETILAQAIRRTAPAAVAVLLALPSGPARAQICGLTLAQVGAHQSHTRANASRAALACEECHPPVCAPGVAQVTFGALASASGSAPAWDPASRTCSGVYCHGATLLPSAGAMTWAWVDPANPRPPSIACAACHGNPPPAPHPQRASCSMCHPDVVLPDGTIDVAGGRHVNGRLDIGGGVGGFGCSACHGFPPATGAHLAHFDLPGAVDDGAYTDLLTLEARFPDASPGAAPARYAFGCALCHSVVEANHWNGSVEVLLAEPGAAPGSLKARAAAGASYDAVTGTCSGTYCHSSGQESPEFRTTPGWASGEHVGCAGCHDNPPAYPSGGAGTATANSHLGLGDDGYEFGHFLGMPGPFHTSKHGGNWAPGEDATPITCQTCHAGTVDPANVAPGGFYYLDTTGAYELPGGDPYRVLSGWLAQQQCGACHAPGGAPMGTGRVLPLRHVNGVRDVEFDVRTELPELPWLPPAPDRPSRPYWMTGASASMPWPAGVSFAGATVSFDLAGASYDPAAKRCSGVACHVADTAPVWGRPYQWLTNGGATCDRCHPM